MPHALILAMSEDDALDFVLTDRIAIVHRKLGAHLSLVWPGEFKRLIYSSPFDHLLVTPAVRAHPDQAAARAWVAACLTRVKGEDGLTPVQRLRQETANA